MKRTLAIWLPNWPVQRLLSKRPELRGRPVVLKHRTVRGECVAACSAEARERGIDVDMPIAEVHALRKRLSDWHQEDHDPAADRAALVRLAGWCHRFSPTVGLEDVAPPAWPETLLLDATNLAPLFGGEAGLVEQVEHEFDRLRLAMRVALADNIATAWAVAHYGNSICSGDLSLGDRRVVDSRLGGVADVFAPLPVAALRLPPGVEQTLLRLGVPEVGDLLALPRDQLQSRFGAVLLERIDQALGRLDEVIEAAPPPPEFTVSQQLEHPLAKREHVEQVVRQLIERLAHLLSTHNVGALQVTCRFDCHTGPPAVLEAGLFRPSSSAAHLLEIVTMHLERRLLPGAVTAVQATVARHGPLVRQQQVLFESGSTLDSSWQLAALVDRLAGRLGQEAIVRCRLHSDAQPELAYRDEPLVGGAKKWRPGRSPARGCRNAPLDRPLQLLERPARVEVLAVADVSAAVESGPPRQFYHRGRRHDVAQHWGPERIETGWWRRRGVSRDYYRVETSTGQRFWLYRCLRSRRWFLQGMF